MLTSSLLALLSITLSLFNHLNLYFMKTLHLLTLLCLLCWTNLQSQSIIEASRLSSPIIFDGKLNDKAWQEVTPLPYRTQLPIFDTIPSEQARVLLAYDNDYLYLAGKFDLSDPSLIRTTTFKRDAFDGTTDYFGLVIDSYLDQENGVAFFTNANGMRWDGTVWNDAQGEMPMSIDWNTFWDVKSTYDEKGWSTEMRIPWSSLRFQEKDGVVVMGITSWWYMAAKNELSMYPLVPLNWGDMSAWKPSQMQPFRFKGIKSQKPLYVAPYLLGGWQQDFDLNSNESAYEEEASPSFEAGIDLKYGITSNLTLDLTVNTDFAQVEADDQQVNLTRFSLFFPEKRIFFQERASIFDFNFDEFNRLFYSRRIGINEDEGLVPIQGGVRLVGRAGKYDVGLLNMQTGKVGSLASENFSLIRVRRQLGKNNSYLGGIVAHRIDLKGQYNTAYGLDAIMKLYGDDYLNVKWAQTFEPPIETKGISSDNARIFANWERRRYDGFSYNLSFSRVGEAYSPGMGFELRENYSSFTPNLTYGWLMDEKSKLLRVQAFIRSFWAFSNESQQIQTGNLATGVQVESKSGWTFNSSVVHNTEYLSDPFELDETVSVPSGRYNFWQLQGFWASPFQKLFGVLSDYTIGEFFDGSIFSMSLSPRIKLSSHWDLEGFYQFNSIQFSSRGFGLEAHLARLKASYLLNTQFSVAAFLQYNSLDGVYTGNIRLRYNPKEGNDLFIVYNDLINAKRGLHDPALPFRSSRAILLKYTYTLTW